MAVETCENGHAIPAGEAECRVCGAGAGPSQDATSWLDELEATSTATAAADEPSAAPANESPSGQSWTPETEPEPSRSSFDEAPISVSLPDLGKVVEPKAVPATALPASPSGRQQLSVMTFVGLLLIVAGVVLGALVLIGPLKP